jgi:hypothetical protein
LWAFYFSSPANAFRNEKWVLQLLDFRLFNSASSTTSALEVLLLSLDGGKNEAESILPDSDLCKEILGVVIIHRWTLEHRLFLAREKKAEATKATKAEATERDSKCLVRTLEDRLYVCGGVILAASFLLAAQSSVRDLAARLRELTHIERTDLLELAKIIVKLIAVC